MVLHQAIERYLRGWARSVGENHGRDGGVTVVQRFGGHPRPRYCCLSTFPVDRGMTRGRICERTPAGSQAAVDSFSIQATVRAVCREHHCGA